MEASGQEIPPPYFAFKTLTNTIVSMEEHGPPTRIDRTFLSNMSGAGQSQFIAGLKSLDLIDEQGTVQPDLTELVENPDKRPEIIGRILRRRYPEAVELGKGNATTGELIEVFREYGVQGDTARKAIAFYLQAAKYAGDIPLSPNFKTPSVPRGSGGGRKRRAQAENGNSGTDEVRDPPPSDDLHPAIRTLVEALPSFDGEGKPDFPNAEREAWFAYARATFNLIYALPDGDADSES
jgi:hypothetical protein